MVRVWIAILLSLAATTLAAEDETCPPGEAEACQLLSLSYNGIPPFPEDRALALKFEAAALRRLEEQCRAQEWEACRAHRVALSRTIPPYTPDESLFAALQLWQSVSEAGCAAGSVRACIERARLAGPEIEFQFLHAGETPPDWTQSQEYALRAKTLLDGNLGTLDDACRSGDAGACNHAARDRLSIVHFSHPFGRQDMGADVREAIEIALIGCSSLPAACDAMVEGAMILAGVPVPGGTEASAALRPVLDDACDRGMGAACQTLATLSQRTEDASAMLGRACDAGRADACRHLGRYLYDEFRRTQNAADLQRATDVLERGCAGADLVACHMLKHLGRQ